MQVELVVDCRCKLGEGVLWHSGQNLLYWVDIEKGLLYRWDCVRSPECFHVSTKLGGFTFQPDGSLLLFCDDGIVKRWDDGDSETLNSGIDREVGGRFNDVIAAPDGSVFCGTMAIGEQLGTLYRLSPDGQMTVVAENIGCSNGMGFSPDEKSFYFTDSVPRTIDIFDYDSATGSIENRRPFITLAEVDGLPDGMTVDANGDLWSAVWGGSCIIHFDRHGTEIERVAMPVPQVTSLAFGGSNLDEMYITTASFEGPPISGGLFRCAGMATGKAEYVSRLACH